MSEIRKPKQKRAQKTRLRLLLAAQKTFSSFGFQKTTAKSIAKNAGAATGTFYQYFTDKDAALRELAIGRFVQIAEHAQEALGFEDGLQSSRRNAENAIEAVVEVLIAYHEEDPALHAVITERRSADLEMDREISSREAELLALLSQRLIAWGHAGDTVALAFVMFHMAEGSVHAHCLGTPVLSDERFRSVLLTSLVQLAFPTLSLPIHKNSHP